MTQNFFETFDSSKMVKKMYGERTGKKAKGKTRPNIGKMVSSSKSKATDLYMLSSIGDIPLQWLKEEIWRIRTFAKYPSTAPKSALSLAANGFVYIGSGSDDSDIVECYCCHKTKKKWHLEDIIQDVHKVLSPDCPMVTGEECSNVPWLVLQTHRTKPESQISSSAIKANSSLPTQKDDVQSDSVPNATQSSSLTIERTQQLTRASQDENQQNNLNGLNTERASTGTAQISSSQIQNPTPSQISAAERVSVSTNSAIETNFSTHNQQTHSANSSSSTQTMPSTSTNHSSHMNSCAPTNSNQTSLNSSHRPISRSSGNTANPTYSDLGIITDRPKRPEYAVRQARYRTFEGWPTSHPITKETLSEAGFYYAGYSDCARCFYCGVGLRNWNDGDNVWVEHARWYPKCSFMKQTLGTAFIKAVQDLNTDHDEISFEMVTDKMGGSSSFFNMNAVETTLKKDPAVKTIVELGFNEDLVVDIAKTLKDSDALLSADLIFHELQNQGHNVNQANCLLNEKSEIESSRLPEATKNLRDHNNQLRQQTLCKICMDNEVSIVFLPCGHLVSCSECAHALNDCPVCRKHVTGMVRAFLG